MMVRLSNVRSPGCTARRGFFRCSLPRTARSLWVRCSPMRDWLIILAPAAVMLWAVLHPEQSQAIADWSTGLVAGLVAR
jgi:hypothetical protein